MDKHQTKADELVSEKSLASRPILGHLIAIILIAILTLGFAV